MAKNITAEIPKSEQKWQAEQDARSLIEAQEVQGDKVRYKRALSAAQKIAKEKQQEAVAAKKIARRKTK